MITSQREPSAAIESSRFAITRRNALMLGGAGIGTLALGTLGVAQAAHAAMPVWNHPFTFRSPTTDRWGEREGGFHRGLDLAPGASTPIYSIASGTVETFSENFEGWAGPNPVVIAHSDGYRSLYAHMATSTVSPGQQIRASTLIGTVGNLGESFGAHLHLEMWAGPTRASAFNPWDSVMPPSVPLASSSPINDPMESRKRVYSIVPIVDGQIELVSLISGKRTPIGTMYHLGLLQRLAANNGSDKMLAAEVEICQGYLALIDPTKP